MFIEFEQRKIAIICESEIKEDVLDRLNGLEDYRDNQYGNRIYYSDTIKALLEDPDDDTNDTTRARIEELYNKVKTAKMIIFIDGE